MRAELSFPGGLPGLVSTSMVADKSEWPSAMAVRVWGEDGQFEVLNPMAPQMGHRVTGTLADGTTVDEELDLRSSYEFQLRAFCRAVAGQERPLTGGQDAVANMLLIDAIYEASGLGVRH
jgi:predicted dehydrogenase